MNVLVTGAAGYIGSHIARALIAAGHIVYALDDLSVGHRNVVEGIFLHVNIGDSVKLRDVFQTYPIDAVVHCAGRSIVSESMQNPTEYYRSNVDYSRVLLQEMVHADVRTIVFSSSCSVYGTPKELPVTEETPFHPESVYAETKMVIERMIEWYSIVHGLRYASLRYFNACGASHDTSSGEWHDPETHLIPTVIRAALEGKAVHIFGNDYPTPDGTCIRDYVHVEDLASAHVRAVEYLQKHTENLTLNLGGGKGYSNLEIVHAVERELGVTIPLVFEHRRAGDPALIEAVHERAIQVLQWRPRHHLHSIISSAVAWEKKRMQLTHLTEDRG